MHDFLIALVFVSMVASPAIVAAFPEHENGESEENSSPDEALDAATAPVRTHP